MAERRESRGQRRADVVRTFVCIEIPGSIKQRIDRLQEELRRIKAQVSWAKPGNIHLTLKFLGDVEASRIDRVHKAVARAVTGIGPFRIEVEGAGCFPSPRSPRVLWIGLSQIPEALKQLSARIEDELAREGFPKEKRKFSPHLTIGRVKNGAFKTARVFGKALEAEAKKIGRVAEWESCALHLMRSEMTPQGSIYTPMAHMDLA